MAGYLFIARPPELGAYPGRPTSYEVYWPPRVLEGGRLVFGRAEYSEPLSPEEILQYTLIPEDRVEQARYILWLEKAEWVLEAYSPEFIREVRQNDPTNRLAWAAAVILGIE